MPKPLFRECWHAPAKEQYDAAKPTHGGSISHWDKAKLTRPFDAVVRRLFGCEITVSACRREHWRAAVHHHDNSSARRRTGPGAQDELEPRKRDLMTTGRRFEASAAA